MRAWTLLMVVAVSGCLGGGLPDDRHGEDSRPPDADPRPGDQGNATGGPPSTTYRSKCPPTDAWRPSEDACVATLGLPVDAASEPAVARLDAERFAVAAISDRSGGLTNGVPGVGAPVPACTGRSLCVWTTRDGGATWAESNPPAGPGRIPWLDPSLAYDDAGRLHLTFLYSVASVDGAVGGIAHAVLADGTWSEPASLAHDERGDRPWMAVHGREVLVVWHDPDQDLHAIRSPDGVHWTRIDAFPSCNVMSRPVWADPWRVACADQEDGVTRVLVLEDAWRAVQELPSGGPVFMALGEDLVVGRRAPDAPAIDLSWLEDGGAATRRVASPDSSWRWVWLSAMAADGGVVHMVLVGGSGEACFHARCDGDRDVHYLAVDRAGRGVADARLTPDARDRDGTVQWFNDFDDVTVADGRGVAAWGDHGLVHWTRIAPV